MSDRAVFYQILLSSVSAINTAGVIGVYARCRQHGVYVEWSSGATAGAVTIESAPTRDYTGTWAPIQTVNFVSGGIVDFYGFQGAYGAVRARVSTAIGGGGTVIVTFAGN